MANPARADAIGMLVTVLGFGDELPFLTMIVVEAV